MNAVRAMSMAEVESALAELDGWALADGAVAKRYGFTDFHQTMAFVNAVAWIAHREDHHPEMSVGYNHVQLRWNTHSVGGISRLDFRCAAMVDALLTDPSGARDPLRLEP